MCGGGLGVGRSGVGGDVVTVGVTVDIGVSVVAELVVPAAVVVELRQVKRADKARLLQGSRWHEGQADCAAESSICVHCVTFNLQSLLMF